MEREAAALDGDRSGPHGPSYSKVQCPAAPLLERVRESHVFCLSQESSITSTVQGAHSGTEVRAQAREKPRFTFKGLHPALLLDPRPAQSSGQKAV